MAESVPRTQKAALYTGPGEAVKITEIAVPEPQADEILVKLRYSGVCHSDVHAFYGDNPQVQLEYPLVGGHEGTGTVASLGSHVSYFELGDRVGIKFSTACLSCEFCKRGFEANCTNAVWAGFRHNGTFQRYAIVKANGAVRIPDEVELSEAAPVLCAGLTAYKAVVEANAQAGQFIVLTGASGGLGSMAIQYARALGLRVIGIDVGPKEQVCRDLGAEFFIDATGEKDVVEEVMKITDGGAHSVVNLATSLAAIQTSLLYVRPRGTVVLVSMPPGAIQVDLFTIILRTITIKTSFVGNRQDVETALEFVSRGQVKSPIEIVKFDQLGETFERIARGQVVGRVVIDLWN